MLEKTSKEGVYRGYQPQFNEEIESIKFEYGLNHHGNGNRNWTGCATFPSVGKMFHYLNIITSGANERPYKMPEFRYDFHVNLLAQSPFRIHFRSNEGLTLFLRLVQLEVEEQDQLRIEREEAGVPEIMTMKFAE